MICHEKGIIGNGAYCLLPRDWIDRSCMCLQVKLFLCLYFSVPCAATAHTVWFLPTPHSCDGLNATWCADDKQNYNNDSKFLLYFCCSALMLLKP